MKVKDASSLATLTLSLLPKFGQRGMMPEVRYMSCYNLSHILDPASSTHLFLAELWCSRSASWLHGHCISPKSKSSGSVVLTWACEMYPGGIKTAPRCGGHHAYIGRDDLYIHRRQETDEEINRGLPKAAIEWDRIVDLYTMFDLTKASDKLIALSGRAANHHSTWLSPDNEYILQVCE